MPLPSPDRLRAADPADPRRTDVRPAGTVFVVLVLTLVTAGLLNAEAMLHRARTSPLGADRDAALAVWEPVERAASSVGLTLPRAGLEAVQDLDPTTRSPSTKLLATGPKGDEDADELAAGPEGTPTPGAVDESGSTGRQGGPGPAIGHEPAPIPPAGPTAVEDGAGRGADGATASGGEEDGGGEGSDDPAGPVPGAVADRAAPDQPASTPGGVRPTETDAAPEGPTAIEGPGSGARAAAAGAQPDAESGGPDSALLRRPTPDDPLRLLVIGDSTLDPVGSALLRRLGDTGVAAGVVDYRVSTGLARPDYFDWPNHLSTLQPELGAEVVVIMLGANDAQAFVVDNRAVEFGTEEWRAEYRRRVQALLDQLTAGGSWVVWIGQPAMRNDPFDQKMQELNAIYAEVADGHPTARFLDSRPFTTDGDGRYANYLVDAGGGRFQARHTDGVHLTSAGGEHLAPAVIAVLDEIAPLGPTR